MDLGRARASASSVRLPPHPQSTGVCVPTTRRSSRNERRCCGSSRTCSAATNRSQWIGRAVDQPNAARLGELLRGRHSASASASSKTGKRNTGAICCGLIRIGVGWATVSRPSLYETLKLFNGYRVRCQCRKSPRQDSPINLDAKQTGERSAGNPHVAFDVAGTGNVHGRDAVTLADERRDNSNTNFDLHRRASLRPYQPPNAGFVVCNPPRRHAR